MKGAVFAMVCLMAVSAAHSYNYMRPIPRARDQNPALTYKDLGDLFHRFHAVATKRCANLFDDSCANGDHNGAGSDDDWLNGDGNPGKRCANLFDESCINGGANGAGSDQDWLGSNSPGRR